MQRKWTAFKSTPNGIESKTFVYDTKKPEECKKAQDWWSERLAEGFHARESVIVRDQRS